MTDRELAVLCTQVSVAIKECSPRRLDTVVSELSATPWNTELLELVKTVRYVLEAQHHAGRGKKR
jgi:hypothetical protein